MANNNLNQAMFATTPEHREKRMDENETGSLAEVTSWKELWVQTPPEPEMLITFLKNIA